MNRKNIFIFYLTVFILTFSTGIFAWWSAVIFRESTHHKLTRLAIEKLDGTAYPDIKRFGANIADWTSGPTDDVNSHGKKYQGTLKAGDYDGGPYEWWWKHPYNNQDGVLVQYKLHNFVNGDYSAYYYLSMMAHLIADQAVPAHAANIYHAYAVLGIPTNPDNLEKNAYSLTPLQGSDPIIKTDTANVLDLLNRYYYYKNNSTGEIDGSIPATQDNLSFWKSLDDKQYWFGNGTVKYIGAVFDSTWGRYGGMDSSDIYEYSKDTQDIIPTQFSQSIAYMAGFLCAASEKLPPLVSNLALDTLQINSDTGAVITFHVEENRMPNIKIKITVDDKAIKTTEKVWDGTTESYLAWNSNLAELPYHGTVTVKWEGLLSDGNYLSDGQHSIVVNVQDADGNWSNESAKDITFSQTIQISKNRRPTFVATINEDVDNSSLKIMLDGVAYGPFTYDFNIGKMVYKPNFDLEFGLHQWKMIGTDTAGNALLTPTYTVKIEPTEFILEDIYPTGVINTSRPVFKGKIRIK